MILEVPPQILSKVADVMTSVAKIGYRLSG